MTIEKLRVILEKKKKASERALDSCRGSKAAWQGEGANRLRSVIHVYREILELLKEE